MKRKGPRPKNRPDRLTEDQLAELICGFGFAGPGREVFESEEERRRLYFKNREDIFSRQGKDVGFLSFAWGERPRAWWDYEAPEPRRQIGGGDFEMIGEKMTKGIPSRQRHADVRNPPVFEGQLEYLKRLGLLFESEEEKVKEAARREREFREKMQQSSDA